MDLLPSNTPKDITKMKGRRRPKLKWQRSLREPNMGVRKNPIRGDRAQTSVMCLCSTPIFNKVGDTKAVSAEYENSIPITAAEMRISSVRVLRLKTIWHIYDAVKALQHASPVDMREVVVHLRRTGALLVEDLGDGTGVLLPPDAPAVLDVVPYGVEPPHEALVPVQLLHSRCLTTPNTFQPLDGFTLPGQQNATASWRSSLRPSCALRRNTGRQAERLNSTPEPETQNATILQQGR